MLSLYIVVSALVILAALNWGAVALSADLDKDFFAAINAQPEVRRVIYLLFGLAGIVLPVLIWQRERVGEFLDRIAQAARAPAPAM